jgi:hypothetical protein
MLRHQLIVLRRTPRGHVRLTNPDRWFFIPLYRWFPAILKVLTIIRPETVVRWHRAGFRSYWRWKSRPRGGRPQIETELRVLIRRMSVENPLWSAPRIHGELLKLGFEVAQSSVAKYMVKRRGPPSQGWRTFMRSHAPSIAAMDLFVVPTIGFKLLNAFVIVRLDCRDLVWINVTAHPTAEWIAHQITDAFPGTSLRATRSGTVIASTVRSSHADCGPWASGTSLSRWRHPGRTLALHNAPHELGRPSGSIRRECVDHIIVLGEAHLRQILKSYARYYNETRTHLALDKDAPVSRPVQRTGVVRSRAWADFITTTAELKFSVLTGISSNALSTRSSTFAGLPRDTTKPSHPTHPSLLSQP